MTGFGTRVLLAALLLLPGAALAQGGLEPPPDSDVFTSSFRFQDCGFKTTGRNPYFILKPGRQLVLQGEDEEGATITLFVTVLRETRDIVLDIAGQPRIVRTRVVEERELEDGELKEVSRNFFAICAKTNDVVYFGEDVDIYEDGEIVSHAGAWLAGVDGARPGIIMPGTFLLGSRYYQEIAQVALDRAEHVAMGFPVDTPLGTLTDCVEVVETTPLEPGAESTKWYCPGVGLVRDDILGLVDIRGVHDVDEDDD